MIDRTVLCSIFCISLSILIGFYYLFIPEDNGGYLKDVTSSIPKIFNILDTNNDGVLNLDEFLSLKLKYTLFQEEDNLISDPVQTHSPLSIKLNEQIVHIQVNFQPLDKNSLRKDISDLLQDSNSTLSGLFDWKKPHKDQHAFGSKSFSMFLPPYGQTKAGFTYYIAKPTESLFASNPTLYNRRFYPPLVDDKLRILHELLSLFHPQAFIWMRFKPQGTVAVIRATSKNFYDIYFRVHAEFQLNEPPLHPLWFTPSQFKGRLIINKEGTIVKFFHMEVPDYYLNVDLEWYNTDQDDSMEVDIGRIPKMSLISTQISVPSKSERGHDEKLSDIVWDSAISEQEALDELEKMLFPFKQVHYYNVSEAFHLASQESKLVHGVVLWGSLVDQSC